MVALDGLLLRPGRGAGRLAAAADIPAGRVGPRPDDPARHLVARRLARGFTERRHGRSLSMAAVTAPAVPTVRQPWIISRREDLLWFQGSVLAGVALLVF